MKKVKINTEYITLGQFLKYIGILRSGAEAKAYLLSHFVTVDAVKEDRRGKKIYPGMQLEIENTSYLVE